MNTNKFSDQFRGITLSATSINIMARFVMIARREGNKAVRLQDKDVLDQIVEIANQSNNQQLKLLFNRLLDDLNSNEFYKDNEFYKNKIDDGLGNLTVNQRTNNHDAEKNGFLDSVTGWFSNTNKH